jgi:bisphosphoglycerate-independent phosphoglycerate mutase (AlkP superfamily)
MNEQGTVKGLLADVAPTVLEILQIPKPEDMTGRSLLSTLQETPSAPE